MNSLTSQEQNYLALFCEIMNIKGKRKLGQPTMNERPLKKIKIDHNNNNTQTSSHSNNNNPQTASQSNNHTMLQSNKFEPIDLISDEENDEKELMDIDSMLL